jgi:hypothetical protein
MTGNTRSGAWGFEVSCQAVMRYSETRVTIPRKHIAQVDATDRER